ncbi:hypothetical protein ACVOMV_21530 [Mesorhizobium atlanticum]
MRLLRALIAAATALAVTAFAAPSFAADDPGPAAYAKALNGKRVMLVPLAMGFDLAARLGALPEEGSRGLGRHVRDP